MIENFLGVEKEARRICEVNVVFPAVKHRSRCVIDQQLTSINEGPRTFSLSC